MTREYQVLVAGERSEPFRYFSDANRVAMDAVAGARPPKVATVVAKAKGVEVVVVASYETGESGRAKVVLAEQMVF